MTAPRVEDDALRAMSVLLRKLRTGEPQYDDEDVVSPHAAPSRVHRMDSPPHPGMPHRDGEGEIGSSPTPSEPHMMFAQLAGATTRQTRAGARAAQPTVAETLMLGYPLTQAATQFNEKELKSSRKATIEIVKLLKAFHAAPWAKDSKNKRNVPISEYRQMMDPLLQSFLVYANVSAHVRNAIDNDIVKIAKEVCLPMRIIETQSVAMMHSNAAKSSPGDGGRRSTSMNLMPSETSSQLFASPTATRMSMSPSMVHSSSQLTQGSSSQLFGTPSRGGSQRIPTTTQQQQQQVKDTNKLTQFLKTHKAQVPPTLLATVMEVFSLEQMIDAYLPPSVCSSRFDGVVTVLHEKKAALVLELATARNFLSQVVNLGDTEVLSKIVVMCAYAMPKVRIKVYDRLIAEGLFKQLRKKLTLKGESTAKVLSATSAATKDAELRVIAETLCFVCDPNMDGEADDTAPPQSSSSSSTSSKKSTGRGRASMKLPSRCVSWIKDPDAKPLLKLCIEALINTPNLSVAASTKLIEFLSQTAKFNDEVFTMLVDCVGTALDQVYVAHVERILPLIAVLLKSPLIQSFSDQMVEVVGGWFPAILIASRIGEVANKKSSMSRGDVNYALPFISFTTTLAAIRWHSGTSQFYTKMFRIVRNIVAGSISRNNIAFGTAHECYTQLQAFSSAMGDQFGNSSMMSPTPAKSAKKAKSTPVRQTGTKRGRSAVEAAGASPQAPPPTPDELGSPGDSFVWFGGESEVLNSPSPVNSVVPWTDKLPFRFFGLGGKNSPVSPDSP